ncbi:MAG TPA: Uma2 family endonuclease [Candidatus Solibacter sp.]|nr:Uma2 family endonuclease [Candidatus Solibacter sp.]
MGAITTRLLTFEEFERLPDTPGKRELLEGEVIELPVPEFKHSLNAQDLFLLLYSALKTAHASGEAAELGAVYIEMGYKLSARSYVRPDVSITHAGQPVDRFLQTAPAIAIEIISPSNTVEEMDFKTKLYFQYGAREVWRIYPKTRHITIHLLGNSHDVGEDEVLTTPLLPGLALSVREILGA